MKKILYILLFIMLGSTLFAQDDSKDDKYRRSSMYSMLISKPDTKFGKEIEDAYMKIPIPDKYNDHNLSVRIISNKLSSNSANRALAIVAEMAKETSSPTSTIKAVGTVEGQISAFLEENCVARRMVGKWFDRDPETGQCSLDLIASRGLYDASYYDVKLANLTVRGNSMLEDAGEELIANSFVLVNDIRYVDKAQTAKAVGGALKFFGAMAAAYTGQSAYQDLGNSLGSLAEQIKGFRVVVDSYLYRLDWSHDIANRFYVEHYIPYNEYNAAKRLAFNGDKSTYKLIYVGKQSVASGQTSIEGINLETPEQMIRKVCARSIDKSIVELQSSYEVFRIKTPIFSVIPDITAKIGMKEGVSEAVKFEVLEKFIDKNDKTQYKRVGVIQPVPGKVWDNRYMAIEEKAMGATLGVTTFRKVSGGDFREGMLIRQIK